MATIYCDILKKRGSFRLAQGGSDGAYGQTRSITTSKSYSSALVVAACGHASTPTVTASAGTLREIVRRSNYYGAYGHGFAMYVVENIPTGAVITANYGTHDGMYAYGQTLYIVEIN